MSAAFTLLQKVLTRSMEYEFDSAIIPELLGPIFKTENVTLRQALYNNNTNRRFRLLATFVPDELILSVEKKATLVNYHFAALLLLDIGDIYSLFDDFCNGDNYGTSGLSKILNLYISAIVEQICYNGGDVIGFTEKGVLAMWKPNQDEVIHRVMRKVISCSFAISEAVQHLESDSFNLSQRTTKLPKMKSGISAGHVTFAVIGEGERQHCVITGEPREAVAKAVLVAQPGDTILAESAWEHCLLSDYVYVLHDRSHIKITRTFKKARTRKAAIKRSLELICKPESLGRLRDSPSKKYLFRSLRNIRPFSKSSVDVASQSHCVAIVQSRETERHIIESRHTILDSCKSQLGISLKSFVPETVLEQIENDRPLEHLTEMRNITVVWFEIVPTKCNIEELVALTNIINTKALVACKNVGFVEDVILRETKIDIRLIFGIRTYLMTTNHCRYAILCASRLLGTFKRTKSIEMVSVGVSTGMTCCTVVGHVARRQYAIIGPPFTKAHSMMYMSQNKVTCDLDTLVYSGLKKSNFVTAGLINLKGFEKGYVFNYFDKDLSADSSMKKLKKAYPIIGRQKELEIFGDILDEIGLPDRIYSGIFIEGKHRSGKSRLLDAYVAIAKSRQMMVFKLNLHPTYASKPYSVICYILEQILEGEDCRTTYEQEKNIIKKLCRILQLHEFCYLNRIMRVAFPLSKEYIEDTDWNRHRKSMMIFEKILKMLNKKKCIVLDNIQFMDYMSWQYLIRATSNKNVVLAMTLLEAQSWEEYSRVEAIIRREKNLLRYTLAGLNSEDMSALICQMLGVQGIALDLHIFVINSGISDPGWFELFLILMSLCMAFDFVSLTPEETKDYNLYFPEMYMVTRISPDLFPEEKAPPIPWNKRSQVWLCLATERFKQANSYINFTIPELSLEIYSKLSVYEQDLLKCAAVLGKLFARNMLEVIMPNSQSLKTSTAIENLMRVRIFECASMQRASNKIEDLVICSFKPKSTFSDMHHWLRCRCKPHYIPPAEKHLAKYAHCRFIEFKVPKFRYIIYDQIPEQERKEFNEIIVDIYYKDARKCTACGGGPFLKFPGKEKTKIIPTTVRNKAIDRQLKRHPADKHNLASEEENNEGAGRQRRGTSISIIQRTFDDEDEDDDSDDDAMLSQSKPSNGRLFFKRRKSKVHPIPAAYEELPVSLNNFGHIDFRNCRCRLVIECIFVKIEKHIEHIDDNDKAINFMMEYAAALIDHGQSGSALIYLTSADERNEYVRGFRGWKNPLLHGKMFKRSIILCLRGLAFMNLGNYPQAQTNFIDALSMYKQNFTTKKLLTYYRTMNEKFRQSVHWNFPKLISNTNLYHETTILMRQNTASCLRYVSEIMIINGHPMAARLACIQSILYGFADLDWTTFYDQCQLYVTIVKVCGKLGDLPFLDHAERYMHLAINSKRRWNSSSDVVMVTHVYASMFKISLLRGHLVKAAQMGVKSLSIAKSLHMVKLQLVVLPSLIQTLIRLKQISETMDMLQQLRDIAHEDVDKSALTWYYALSLDMLLDAGILIESFETCATYARKTLDIGGQYRGIYSGSSVVRDSRSVRRLVSGLWTWQLRKGHLTSTNFVQSLDFFTDNLEADDFSQITTLCKILECHLLLLTRCVNMKKGGQMELLLDDIELIFKLLSRVSKVSDCIKPHYYLLKAYYCLLHSRTMATNKYLRMATSCAESQQNQMARASIHQNKSTWKAESYNNMALYWEENIGYRNMIAWQDIDMFDLGDWSNLLYSLPRPESYI